MLAGVPRLHICAALAAATRARSWTEDLEPGTVVLRRSDREMSSTYYHDRGSLTTPPYTETLDWLVVKTIQQASPEQIRRINLIEGDNARRVQALYERKVES